MCNKITKISSQNKYQWIGVCVHGAAHICWRSVQVCIPGYQLEDLMNRALAKRLPVEKRDGEYLFWLNRVAIRLNEKDYQQMEALFALASEDPSMLPTMHKQNADESSIVLH